MNDFPIHHDSADDESTEGHKIRWIDDADDSVNRNIDESTSGHRRRMDLEDADEESTSGHRRRMDLEDADEESTEGHRRIR